MYSNTVSLFTSATRIFWGTSAIDTGFRNVCAELVVPVALPPTTMSRQFFVGGNFKMNPASKQAKVALVETLNKADLDPNTGLYRLLKENTTDLLTAQRGRGCSAYDLPAFLEGHSPQGRQSLCPELLLQTLRSVHRRNQVSDSPQDPTPLPIDRSPAPPNS